jgi:hypothetical protein
MADEFLPTKRHGKRELTEKQLALLDNLEACNYDPVKAAEMAGYAYPQQAVRSVREELTNIAHDLVSNSSLRAAATLTEIMTTDRPIPNIKEKIAAANSLLDRGGIAKREILDVNQTVKGGVFVLPEKKPTQIEDAEYTVVQDDD